MNQPCFAAAEAAVASRSHLVLRISQATDTTLSHFWQLLFLEIVRFQASPVISSHRQVCVCVLTPTTKLFAVCLLLAGLQAWHSNVCGCPKEDEDEDEEEKDEIYVVQC